MKIGKYFTRQEFEYSPTAIRHHIRNVMSAVQLANAQALCTKVLDLIRDHYDRPVYITSGFRNRKVNSKVGGSGTSQHCLGQAADINVPGVTVEQLFLDIKSGKITGLKYDQLIQEFNAWIHISYSPRLRRENLRAIKKNGRTVYLNV